MFRPYKIKKTDPEPMEKLMKLFIVKNGLATGMNCQMVFEAWNKVSGAASFTIGKFYRDGTLYCTISSSVVRNQLYFQKDTLVSLLNEELRKNPLFDLKKGLVKNLILK